MTRGVDAVEDVFDRSGSKGGANVPSVEKAVSYWRTRPGVEEVGGEIGKAEAVLPSGDELSTSRNIN